MHVTVEKLYTNEVDLKTEGRYLLLAKSKKEGLDRPSHLRQILDKAENQRFL